MESDSARTSGSLDAVFADFLRRREKGEELLLEDFARGYPELEQDLLRLGADWQRLSGYLNDLAADGLRPTTLDGGLTPLQIKERLAQRRPPSQRYRVEAEIARGGMGSVLSVWDDDLRRRVAMKVMLEGEGPAVANASKELRRFARFLEEAQIAGQLDHPGIVPVHELGVDEGGRLYFTLKLVKGKELKEVFRAVHAQREGWNQTRALGSILRVCEAMAFAHERGVIHRDLKPSNIMVGRHGETYVMDWGLARVFREASLDTAQPAAPTEEEPIHSNRHAQHEDAQGSALLTLEGEVLGTPHYMPPEQARGELERVGPAADVYAVGAMLYELLSGNPPYVSPGKESSPYAVWYALVAGPPAPLSEVAPRQPAELVAICAKAMSREQEERYRDMAEMAEDLRAFLENRVVRAYRIGAMAELRKWVVRNRRVASLLGLLVLVLSLAGFWSAHVERNRQFDRVDRLASALVDEAQGSWPLHPAQVPAMQRWLAGAETVLRWRPQVAAKLEQLAQGGRPYSEEDWADLRHKSLWRYEIASQDYLIQNFPAAISELEQRLSSSTLPDERAALEGELETCRRALAAAQAYRAELEARVRYAHGLHFARIDQHHVYQRWKGCAQDLQALGDESSGWLSKVRARLELAGSLGERSLEAFAERWAEAIATIANPDLCPAYSGLKLRPQLGLVPLRQNLSSGLWEFFLLDSGEFPAEDADQEWHMLPDTGVVLVLIPAGEVVLGAQATDPDGPNYDPAPYGRDVNVATLKLAPFFLSKYELTQAQWQRLGGPPVSVLAAGHLYANQPRITAVHPVEGVRWEECRAQLARWNLCLPTGAQWEYAARCGEPYIYGPWGSLEEMLATEMVKPNWADEDLAASNEVSMWVKGYHDGFVRHSPVTAEGANYFGLVGIYGNVSEWILDVSDPTDPGYGSGALGIVEGTGERLIAYSSARTARGGNWLLPAAMGRVAARINRSQNSAEQTIGVRPCRLVEE